MGSCDAQCAHSLQLAWLNSSVTIPSLFSAEPPPVWRQKCEKSPASKSQLSKLMAIATRTVTADRLADTASLACFWISELRQIVTSWVTGADAADPRDAVSLLVLSRTESLHLLCHLIDLARGIGAVDCSSLVKCIGECIDTVGRRDGRRVALAAYLPLVNLAGIVCARENLSKGDAKVTLNIAQTMVRQLGCLEPAAMESTIALVYCLTVTNRLDTADCVADMLKAAVSVLGFGHKQLKVSVGRLVQALLSREQWDCMGLVDATYALLGDDSAEVRSVWSRVASMLVGYIPSLCPGDGLSCVTEISPVTPYLRKVRRLCVNAATGDRDLDECAGALSMDDALAVVGGIVGSSKLSAAELVADIGLSPFALQCIYSIYRATSIRSNSTFCAPGVYEKIMLMVTQSARRIGSAEPSECLSTASYVIDSVKQCQSRSTGAIYWMLELIFHLCQPGRPAYSLLDDRDTKLLLLGVAAECSNIAFAAFVSSLVVQQLQCSPDVGSSRRQTAEAVGRLASELPLALFTKLLDCGVGDALDAVVGWCVSASDPDTVTDELYSLSISDDFLLGNPAAQGAASIRLSRFDDGAEFEVGAGLAVNARGLEGIGRYIENHRYALFLADRFLDRAVCRATGLLSAAAAAAAATASAADNGGLQLLVEKTYWLSSLPTASQRDRLAAATQAFARGDIGPGRILELLSKWVHVGELDKDGRRAWWKTYVCSAVSAAFNCRFVDVKSSVDGVHRSSQDLISIVREAVPMSDCLDVLFARKPYSDIATAALETGAFIQSHRLSRDTGIDSGFGFESGVDATKAKEALLYLASGDKEPSDVISRLITDLLMESPGKLRPTATGIFDPGSFLISRMSTNPAQAPVLLSDRLNRNAQTQLAPFIPQLFAMLCFNRNSRGSGGGLDSSHVLANDGALGILRRFAQCAPELVVFYAVVSHKSLPKASRGGYFVEQLLSLFDPSMVADIRLFLLLAGDIAVLPQEQLRRACIKAKTVHRRAVSALIQGTSADAQVAVDESLRPVYKVIGEFAGKETAQSPVVTEFMARIPRLKLLVDRLGSRSVDMTRAAGCLRDFEAVWSEIFKATSLASSLAIGYISPRLMEFRASIPIPSLTDPMEPFYYAQIGGAMRVIGSKTRPKLISLQLGNAAGEISRHKYILKGSEDLRIDECVMQGFVRLNRVLAGGGSVGGSGRGGCLAVYNVVPIDTYGGLLQVVDNAPSLFHLYSKHAALKLAFESSRQSDDRQQQQQQPVAMPAVPVGFHQVYMGQAQEVLARFGLPALLPIDKWPHGVFVAVYEALVEHGSGVSDGLLYDHLLRAAQSSSHLFLTMQNMVRSIAIASVAGYIFGLGDRHLDNLLVDAAAGQLVHVDFNVCFDFGSVSQIPEQVPFRMSPALSYLCGMPLSSDNKDEGGVVGAFSFGRVFESTARSVLKCARMDRRCLVDAVVGRCLFRPFMEWCWMEESRYREEQRRGSRGRRLSSGALSPAVVSPVSATFASFQQPEDSTATGANGATGAGDVGEEASISRPSLLQPPPPSLPAAAVDRVWNQSCETMRTDELVRATGLCPPNGFWPRRPAASAPGNTDESLVDDTLMAELVYPVTEVPYGWRIACEARDRVDARLAYHGGDRLRDDDRLVAEQIRVLWEAATCKHRLSRMFMGWAPWI